MLSGDKSGIPTDFPKPDMKLLALDSEPRGQFVRRVLAIESLIGLPGNCAADGSDGRRSLMAFGTKPEKTAGLRALHFGCAALQSLQVLSPCCAAQPHL